jgi:integrase
MLEEGDIIITGPFRVADAMAAYFKDAERRGVKGIDRDRDRANAWIIPALGETLIPKLTRNKIENWLDAMANSPKRLRTKIGAEQKFGPAPITDDQKRARKDSANRVLTVLKAALSFAVDRRLVAPKERPWELVKPYKGTTSARIRFLTQEEQVRLVNVCPPDFRELVRGALFTGCRYGELTQLKCKDYDPGNGSIFVAESKSGKPRHVYLTEEGRELFDTLTAKPDPESHVFTNKKQHRGKSDEEEGKWRKDGQIRAMQEACKAAGIEPVSFHELRHTYASMLVNQGCLLAVVARQLGHSDTRMVEKHYAHLAPNTVRDEVLKAMPRLGLLGTAKVSKLKLGNAK